MLCAGFRNKLSKKYTIQSHASWSPQENRAHSADAARGIAALLVALFHFTNSAPFNNNALLKPFAQFGWLGVEVFFVISGFVIPLACVKFGQSVRANILFFGRRWLRLSLPFYAAVVLTLILSILSSAAPTYAGKPFSYPNIEQIGCHIFYACTIFSQTWFSPVYWTLAIEMQFYVAVCLLVIFTNYRGGYHFAALCILLLLVGSLFAPDSTFIAYAPLFFIGFVVALAVAGKIHWKLESVGYLVGVFFCWRSLGMIEAFVSILSVGALKVWRFPAKRWLWIGSISYSLYLLHVPVGGRIINLALRTNLNWFTSLVALGFALLTSVFVAWLFWKWLEFPAQQLARRVFPISRTSVSKSFTTEKS